MAPIISLKSPLSNGLALPYILYPAGRDTFLPGAPVRLEGGATDREDGAITDDTRFIWYSSRQGFLGVGRNLFFDDLLPGRHTITLTVQDNDGFTAQQSVSIFIGHHIYLPLILKSYP